MDHIWEAPSKLKKTLALIFLKILAIILRQDFLKTLYTVPVRVTYEVWRVPRVLLTGKVAPNMYLVKSIENEMISRENLEKIHF